MTFNHRLHRLHGLFLRFLRFLREIKNIKQNSNYYDKEKTKLQREDCKHEPRYD